MHFICSDCAVRNIHTYPTIGFEPSPSIIQQVSTGKCVNDALSAQCEAILEALDPHVIASGKQPITLIHWMSCHRTYDNGMSRKESHFGGEEWCDHLVVIAIAPMLF